MSIAIIRSLLDSLLKALLFLRSLTYQVDLVPYFEIFFFQHGVGKTDLFDDLKHSFLLKVSLRVANVTHMH